MSHIFLRFVSFSLFLFVCTSVFANSSKVDFTQVTEQLIQKGDALIQSYDIDNAMNVGDEFSNLYFDVFEASGMETAIGMANPELKTKLESQFSQIIGYAMKQVPMGVVSNAWQTLKEELQKTALAQKKSSTEQSDFWSVLLQAFFILLREGFEAILVITALVAYLKRSAPEKVSVIWYGVSAALVASLATAWLLNTVISVSGAQQEALEGLTMLLASAVLFYVSYWLISKREADRWQTYINGKIDQAVSTGGLLTLGFAAFLAVYREGAETVLFYQALAGSIDGQYLGLFSGIMLAAVTLVFIYWLMYKTSVKLPMGLFFTVTAILLYYLAFTFIGRGILELQEARWLPITPEQWLPHIEWLGMFPTWETFAAQLVFLLPLPMAWYLLRNKTRLAAESAHETTLNSKRVNSGE